MFRSPQGKILRHMFEHPVVHDLADAPASEKGLIFLLMSIAGNPLQPDGTYSANLSVQAQFPDFRSAIDALRSRGYLVEPLPREELLSTIVVADLKALLKSHNLPVGGKRAELVARLFPVLTDEDIAQLRETHSFCLPSSLGYEMIYSLYDLWERRQLALMDAIQTGDIDSINIAIKRMPYNTGFWDDSSNNFSVSSHILHRLRGVSSPYVAIGHICPGTPEFNIRKISEDAQQEIIESRRILRTNTFYDKLAQYRACGAKQVRWDSCGRSTKCDALDGKIFPIDQIPQFPICPDCLCSVMPIYELPNFDRPLSVDSKSVGSLGSFSQTPPSASAYAAPAPQKPIFDSPRISYVPQKSVSDPPRAVFAPLPDPEPAPPKERHTGKIIFGIVVAIVLIILLFFS